MARWTTAYPGRVRLRLVNTADAPRIAADWSTGYGRFQPGWDLERIGGGTPAEFDQHLPDPRSFVEGPRVG